MKTAIITGVTGQDGCYLAKLLLSLGYRVIGTYRRSTGYNFWRLDYFGLRNEPNLELAILDIQEPSGCIQIVDRFQPDEIYNLASQSFVGISFDHPYSTTQINGLGCLNILEAIRKVNRQIKFYQASTSEMFGKVVESPQNEDTPFYPRSPYAISKLYSHWITVNYREAYDIFAASGILFNHESCVRGEEFVTRKITMGLSRIKCGLQEKLLLGNLNAKRDWGHAADFVIGMHKILQHSCPENFVLSTNKSHSVREFIACAAKALSMDIEFVGEGLDEHCVDRLTGKKIIEINPQFYRPTEVELLLGSYEKARKLLNWKPTYNLEQLTFEMADADFKRAQAEML